MSRFIVVHQANYEKLDSFENMVNVARQMAHAHGAEVVWRNSWWAPGDEVLICEWEAPDRDTLDSLLARVCEYWPVAKIYDVLWSDPQWYEAEG
jgi:hypothetical protein